MEKQLDNLGDTIAKVSSRLDGIRLINVIILFRHPKMFALILSNAKGSQNTRLMTTNI